MTAFALGAGPVLASDDHGNDRGDGRRDGRGGDHDLAHRALEEGQVLPLRTVLDRVEREYQGQVLKVEFERDDGRFVYKIRLLQKDGRVVRLEVDAVDGAVLGVKRKER